MPSDIHDLPAFKDRIKTCGRCNHTWYSHSANPVRCPGCGTYYWQGESTVNTCCICGHEWFSRTAKVPLRCPSCKTRSWKSNDAKERIKTSKVKAEGINRIIVDMYLSGKGCVEISMKTGVALSNVVSVVRSMVSDGHATRM